MSAAGPGGWRRLDRRMIWVDAAQTALSLTPATLAFAVFGTEPNPGTVWPVVIVAVLGVVGAGRDALRWVKTRYRITDEYVQRRTGLLVRKYRSIRRDRIRSVDTTAKLRHRLAGLRVVTIGAGQQSAAGEALALDAVSRHVAERLRHDLLHGPASAPTSTAAGAPTSTAAGAPTSTAAGAPTSTAAGAPTSTAAPQPEPAPDGQQVRELARIRWSWVFYNMFNVWAYLAGAGVLWGVVWLASSFGLDPVGYAVGLLDWGRLGWVWTVLVGLVAVGLFGVGVLAVSFVTENWNFRLVRVGASSGVDAEAREAGGSGGDGLGGGGTGTVLRTSQGLFKTREVNRDEHRLRGVEISEPLLWRWMGMADTNVITTGLAIWSLTPATTIVPRGPIGVARRVAAAVLDQDPSPFEVALRRHPRAALYRRLWWALLSTAAVVAVLTWLAAAGAGAGWVPLAGLAVAPVALAAAVVAYRALGHARAGGYLVVRSGLVSRSTAALQSRAVVGWCLSQSVLQRRLGLASVAATTAAGYGYYAASDLDADEAVTFADRAVPDLLHPFVATEDTDD